MLKKFKILTVLGICSTFAGAITLNARASAVVPIVNEQLSVSTGGTQGDQTTYNTAISGDGRYVVFESSATNLVSGDTNNSRDIFLRDRANGATSRISVSSAGVEGDSDSTDPRISYDGQYIVFASYATNLVSGDTNSSYDVFIYDLQAGTTSLVSKNSGGTIGNSHSNRPDISADGRFVVFQSYGSNLVSGINPAGVGQQIFLKDLSNGAIKALSVTSAGAQGNSQE